MLHIFEKIRETILQKVPDIKWIDMDEGQLDLFDQAIPCDFPCVLIDFPQARFDDLGDLAQIAEITVQLKVIFKLYEKFNSAVPQKFKQQAFDHLNIVWAIMKALHGLESNDPDPARQFSKLIRREFVKDPNYIDPKVYTLTFTTTIQDNTLQKEYQRLEIPVNFKIPKP